MEPQFFRRDAELHQLGLVHADGIVVGLGSVVDAVFQVLDGQVLIFDGVLHLGLDFLHQFGLEGGVLHELVQLCLLLFQLFQLGL